MPRILSVEDDPDFQRLIESALQGEGFELHCAYDGPQGRDMALAISPDLILMDMMLPGLSGLEVIKLLKENEATRHVPIIVLTAFPAIDGFFESEVKSHGASLYMRKPVHFDTLVKVIRRLLAPAAR